MKYVLLGFLAACGEPSAVSPPVQNAATAPAAVALPADAALGVLSFAPIATRDLGNWIPAAPAPFLVEDALREGKGPPPSWLAIDRAGAEVRLTYGETMQIKYGCDDNLMTVSKLTGDGVKLKPGLLWLRPLDAAAWAPKALSIVNGTTTAARRDYTIGPVTLELVRADAKRGSLHVAWRGRRVHRVPIERHDMDGAENDRMMDLTTTDVGVPIPEAAWSFANEGAVLLVLRRQAYEGTTFEVVVVNAETGRRVEAMAMYLYYCAF